MSEVSTVRSHAVDEVYGISRDLPLNYVEREAVDEKLKANLARKQHIVIYGSSKQGKTSLRKRCLKSEEYILVQCSNLWDLADLQSAILKQAGYQVTLSEKKTTSGRNKILASISASLLGIGSQVSREREKTESNEITTQDLELDVEDVNDVMAALKTICFDKYIVLEDFHYLPDEVQKHFSVALKAFHEASSYCFIIIGVWLEENRLIVHNGDLTGRVIAVDADRWTDEELLKVIDDGARLLNVEFTDSVKKALISESFNSV